MTDGYETAAVEAEIDENEQEDAVKEETAQEETKKEDKRPSSVVKLLKQRNDARKELEEAKTKLQDTEKLAKKVAELEEQFAKSVLDTEKKVQKTEFFTKNPNAKELESDIEDIMSKKDLSYDEAFKLAAADKKPELLLDEQYRNKATATSNLTWVAKENVVDDDNPTDEDIKKRDDDKFLQRGNNMAKKERLWEWKLR